MHPDEFIYQINRKQMPAFRELFGTFYRYLVLYALRLSLIHSYPYHFGEVPFYDALRVGVVGSVVCDGVVCRLRYS